jgi:hypothetical protein
MKATIPVDSYIATIYEQTAPNESQLSRTLPIQHTIIIDKNTRKMSKKEKRRKSKLSRLLLIRSGTAATRPMVSTVGSVSSLGGAGDGRSSFDSPFIAGTSLATPFTAGVTGLLVTSAPSDPIPSSPECGAAAQSPLADATAGVNRNQRPTAATAPDATVVVAVGRRWPRTAGGGGIRAADAAARGEKKGLGWKCAGAATAALRRDAWVATDVGMGGWIPPSSLWVGKA